MLNELSSTIPHLITAAVCVLLLVAAARVVPRDRAVQLWIFAAIFVLLGRLPSVVPAGILAPLGPLSALMHLVALLAILAGVEKHAGRPAFGTPVRVAVAISAIVYPYAFTMQSVPIQSLVTSPVIVALLLLIGLRLGSGTGPVERRVVPIIRWVWFLVALSSFGRVALALAIRWDVWTGADATALLTMLRVANPTLFSTAIIGLSLLAFARLADAYGVARRDAEEATAAKGRLLANMSHDLRTPLNAIMGFSEVICDAMVGPLSTRYRDYGDDIHRSADHLLGVINRVLSASELESGRRRLIQREHAIHTLVTDSVRLVTRQAEARGIRLEPHLRFDGPLHCDAVAIVEILSNLLANAVAASPPDETVELWVDRTDDAVLIAVADRGPGLPPEVLADLGRPFNRAGDAFVAGNGRGGLGLSISLGLAALHDGALEPSARPGGGTVMTLRLPAERLSAAVAA